jgi:hypothetical protein
VTRSPGLRALLRRGRRAALARKVAGPRADAEYQEALRKAGQKLAAKPLSGYLSDILEEVGKADSLEDARARVLERYRMTARPMKLAEAIRQTNILAHLSGRFAARENP